MVAPRSEPGRGTEEKNPPREPKPEAAPAPAAREPQGSSWQAWLPLGVAVLLMPAIAYAMTTFVLVPKMQKALRSPATVPAEAGKETRAEAVNAGKEALAPGDAGQSVTLNKLLVNVSGTMGSRYLLSSITLLGDASDFPARVSQHEPQLRDMASGILNTKTIADLEKPGARNLIRGELLAGFNTIMGSAAVREIYFTEFAIQ
jgi:flagellar FliL protein